MSTSMNVLLYTVRAKFASLTHVSTDTVLAWLSRPRAERPLLFDTRTADEFSVSHLPGAVHLHPDSDDAALRAALRQHLPDTASATAADPTTVACYCSLGYRSSTVASRLNKLRRGGDLPPFEAVNIDGSIFKWAVEGKPLVDVTGAATKFVHPYNKVFGRVIDPELWKFPADVKAQ